MVLERLGYGSQPERPLVKCIWYFEAAHQRGLFFLVVRYNIVRTWYKTLRA